LPHRRIERQRPCVTVLHCDILVNIIIVIIIANVGSCIKSPTKAARLLHGLLKQRPPE
jgi:hypothetical protein